MKVIGITGAVATGKSTSILLLKFLGYKIFDADAVVAKQYQENTRFLTEIRRIFPDCLDDENHPIKALIANRVFDDASARRKLEFLLHPIVQDEAVCFIQHHMRQRRSLVFLDVPLLLQSDLQDICSEIWVTNCSSMMQRRRALLRSGWDDQRFSAIAKLQLPKSEQLRLADRVIYTGAGKGTALRCIKRYIKNVSRETLN